MKSAFTNFELFQMFNVDCSPNAKVKGTKVRYIEAPYVFNDINCPLWVNRKRKISKRVRPFADSIKPGITEHEPGTKGRVADLVRFYAANAAGEVSAFEE